MCRKLGIKGPYMHSFVSEYDGEVYHVLTVQTVAKGRGFHLGNPFCRREVEVCSG